MVFQEWTVDYRAQRTYSDPDSSPDSDSDTEAVCNVEGKVAGEAPPPRPHDQLQHDEQPQPVNEKKLNQAMEIVPLHALMVSVHDSVIDARQVGRL